MSWKQTAKKSGQILLILLLTPSVVHAAQSSSSNYQVNEVFFGSGGELNACSSNYCSKQSAGETVVGGSSSANYQARGGFNTNRDPYIEFTVSNTNLNLGVLSKTSTATANATFSVKTYLAYGYSVVNSSDPPTYGSYIMKNLTIPTASTVGTEQFGINLAANTIPTTFGANATQNPSNTFSFGQVAASYSSPNYFLYNKGDTIAYSTSSSGFTDYTLSYIFNIGPGTPGGFFNFSHVIVATGTY